MDSRFDLKHDFGTETAAQLTNLEDNWKQQFLNGIGQFIATLHEKWKQTTANNLSDEVFGPTGLFQKCSIFDPHFKGHSNQNFEHYEQLFRRYPNQSLLKDEFISYLLEPEPENTMLSPSKYWFDTRSNFPNLSLVALDYLSLSCGNKDCERSFSQSRDVLSQKRTNSSLENLKMLTILYINRHIDLRFE